MNKKDALQSYRKKRDFNITAEPFGDNDNSSRQSIFVIQKHQASRLHYDFRLEIDGVLKSWAAPKGPSTNPCDKRLALETEDHPIEYARFEGNIPSGQYGAGTVIVWDIGVYRNLRESESGTKVPMEQAYREGRLAVWLEGKKLRGGYTLIRMKMAGKPQWLLIKIDDEHADPDWNAVESKPESAISGLTLEELAAAKPEKPQVNKKAGSQAKSH